MTRIFSAAIALALSTGIGHAASLELGAEAPALTPIGHIAWIDDFADLFDSASVPFRCASTLRQMA